MTTRTLILAMGLLLGLVSTAAIIQAADDDTPETMMITLRPKGGLPARVLLRGAVHQP